MQGSRAATCLLIAKCILRLRRRAALALAVGCIIRSKGGIALQSTLNLVANTFLAVAAVCTGPVQLWLLHGLWLTANAAGPAFLPHVKARICIHTLTEQEYCQHGQGSAVQSCHALAGVHMLRSETWSLPTCADLGKSRALCLLCLRAAAAIPDLRIKCVRCFLEC